METLTSWEEKGMEKKQRTIALNLLRENLPLEVIARATEMTIAQLQELQSQTEPTQE